MTLASNVGAYAEPMAEHVVATVLALAKQLLKKHHKLAQGEFNQFEKNRMVAGCTVGILGLGSIGKATARLFRGLGCRLHAIDSSGRTAEAVDFIGTLQNLDRVLQAADVVVLSIALNKHTRQLIGRRELQMMKPSFRRPCRSSRQSFPTRRRAGRTGSRCASGIRSPACVAGTARPTSAGTGGSNARSVTI